MSCEHCQASEIVRRICGGESGPGCLYGGDGHDATTFRYEAGIIHAKVPKDIGPKKSGKIGSPARGRTNRDPKDQG